MNTQDFHWLIGLLEGEGTFLLLGKSRPVIALSMTDKDVVQKVANLWQRSVVSHSAREETHKPYFTTRISGRSAAFFMKQILPYMGDRRQYKISEILNDYTPKSLPLSAYEKIRQASKRLTHQEIADEFDIDRTYVTKIINGDYGQEAKTLACDARDTSSNLVNHPPGD